ncbi:Uncharacterised protein [Vibrio cholerae]|uniref:Uncharacterized protein n=1 Tax=Vibrio cholerae TaxID=666 RepID=A0A655PTI6_VIBCL|nr:Uncharacterised protein [Vibrio cholerae]CSB95877.1 Uncharacterised protein [Vibrio cholerae]CSB99154.1 Uncharacterised protein [Vibrio cholerae]CSD28476.1 Uncharacterised protein [Vibrio cholerae]
MHYVPRPCVINQLAQQRGQLAYGNVFHRDHLGNDFIAIGALFTTQHRNG